MISTWERPLAIAAGVGWAISIVIFALGVAGVEISQVVPATLFFGVFPLWLCAIWLLQRQMSVVPNHDLWMVAFRGCPKWMRYGIWASWGLGFLSAFLLNGERGLFDAKAGGFIAAFYAVACGVFVTVVATRDEPTECSNGHRIGPFDKFCRECGEEIKRTNSVELVR